MTGLFSDPKVPWEQGCGGGVWGVVCQAWSNVNTSEGLNQNIKNIDILFSLQHNNGAVLDKVKKYADASGSHAWIKKALDFKFDNRDFWNFYDKISPSLRRLAGFAIKTATGKTLEQLKKEKVADQ